MGRIIKQQIRGKHIAKKIYMKIRINMRDVNTMKKKNLSCSPFMIQKKL